MKTLFAISIIVLLTLAGGECMYQFMNSMEGRELTSAPLYYLIAAIVSLALAAAVFVVYFLGEPAI